MKKTRCCSGIWLAAALIVALAGGCAGAIPKKPSLNPVAIEPQQADRGWWYVRFIRERPEGAETEPAWYMDLLIANEVVAPVLARYEANLPLWRFHRRSAHDRYGHALSFIIYTTPPTAEAIYAEIRSAPLLRALVASGSITQVTYDKTDKINRPGVEDVSDKNWPLTIQKAWPHFIMGVSQTWLDLVSQKADELGGGNTPATLYDQEMRYRQVSKSIDDLWREEGRHAFLHHLNAVFGYEPLIIYEKKLQRF